MKKKVKIFLIFIIIAFGLFRCSSIVYESIRWYRKEITTNCFSSAADFEKTSPFEVRKIKDIELQSTMQVQWSYAKRIKWNNHSFKVYAYIFSNTDDLKEYGKRVSGGLSFGQEQRQGYTFSHSLLKTKYVAYSGNCLFRIVGFESFSLISFLNWLASDFGVPIN